MKSHQGQGLISDLKLMPFPPCKLFREQLGTSARTSLPVMSNVLGHAASWHTEEYVYRFCHRSFRRLKSKLCLQSFATQINVPFSFALTSTSLGPFSDEKDDAFSGEMDIAYFEQESFRIQLIQEVRVSRQNGFFRLTWDEFSHPIPAVGSDIRQIFLPALTDLLSTGSSSISVPNRFNSPNKKAKFIRG